MADTPELMLARRCAAFLRVSRKTSYVTRRPCLYPSKHQPIAVFSGRGVSFRSGPM